MKSRGPGAAADPNTTMTSNPVNMSVLSSGVNNLGDQTSQGPHYPSS